MDVITFAELATMIYFSLDGKRYIDAEEAEFKIFDLDTELAFFRIQPNEVVVVYKGSCSIIDWKYNLKCWMKPFEYNRDVLVHHGMNEKIKTSFEFLKNKIRPDDNVYITGHSLGGALSLLGAYAIKNQIGANIKGVYVFGSPPVGNKAWAEAYNCSSLKDVTHDYLIRGDWVGFLPLKGVGYRAVGRETIHLEAPSHFPSSIQKHMPWVYVTSLRHYTEK
jgi:hypothetical protein